MSGGIGDGAKPNVDLAFDPGTLHEVRAEVRSRAGVAGMPENRAGDVILAVHELAANAIRHGAGAGRLRIWNMPGALRCQVDDGDLVAPGAVNAAGQSVVNSWPDLPGHGLWVVRQLADQMQILSGRRGTSAMITFDLT